MVLGAITSQISNVKGNGHTDKHGQQPSQYFIQSLFPKGFLEMPVCWEGGGQQTWKVLCNGRYNSVHALDPSCAKALWHLRTWTPFLGPTKHTARHDSREYLSPTMAECSQHIFYRYDNIPAHLGRANNVLSSVFRPTTWNSENR
jgi:hypothetical protein